ncbi:cytochrome P450 [Moorena producens]|uniref:cytochrome P450 n=1 Tax=Moorena producens TaxID=1155739 RepID=UPI003C740050
MQTLKKQKKTKIPSPFRFPIVGRIASIIQYVEDSIHYSDQLFKRYGHIVAIATGRGTNISSPDPNCPATVIVYGSEIFRQVAMQHHIYHKCPLTGSLYRLKDQSPRTETLKIAGVGLFGLNDEIHLQHRKLIMPAFHQQKINSYCEDIVTITQSELEKLNPNQLCEVTKLTRNLTLRVVTKTLFGEDISNEKQSTGELLEDILVLLASPFTRLLPFDRVGFPFHQCLDLLIEYKEKMKEIIANKKYDKKNQSDLLSMLLQTQEEKTGFELTEDELIGHVGVIFGAGHDTTAQALNWILFLLSQHPQILSDLVDELNFILQEKPPTITKLSQLSLLDRVIKEGMRVLPSVPWNWRVTSQETELGGYELLAGTEVFVSLYHNHRQPDIYPAPQVFNPQRWENFNPSPYEYSPFSTGPRVCIGAGLAIMEMKIILATLLQSIRLEYIPGHKIDRAGLITMKPKYGLPMIVRPQDRNFNQGVGGVKGNVRDMVELPQ